MKYLQVKLPLDLHKAFKRWCFDNETNMSIKIKELIEKTLKGD